MPRWFRPSTLPDSAVPLSPLGDEQGEALALFFASLPESERPTHGFSSPFKPHYPNRRFRPEQAADEKSSWCQTSACAKSTLASSST
jgi:hypothetical protein